MDYPNTDLIWPDDWNNSNQIAQVNIPQLAAGSSLAVQAVWPQALVNIASGYAHPCMVVQALRGNWNTGPTGRRSQRWRPAGKKL